MNAIKRVLYHPFFIKLFHWEYWNFWMIYAWILPVWFLLCLRARSFFFFSASNPSIQNGGFADESKKDIYPLIPKHITPRSVFFDIPVDVNNVADEVEASGLRYPLVGKPNKGGKGKGVRVLKSRQDLSSYVRDALVDFHVQEFVALEHEVGIFYHRIPGAASGKITGIVRKEFLSVTGDGIKTLKQLICDSKRALMQLHSLEKMYGELFHEVIPRQKTVILVPYGNHARGAKFIDDTHLVDENLENAIDTVCKQIPDFYFGRLDIRFNSWEELKQGKNFSIIEVNGAGSEPTHIYDPRHSIFFAWKELIRHWMILYRISAINHKRGVAYLNWNDGVQMFRNDKENIRLISMMTE